MGAAIEMDRTAELVAEVSYGDAETVVAGGVGKRAVAAVRVDHRDLVRQRKAAPSDWRMLLNRQIHVDSRGPKWQQYDFAVGGG